jgi:hypothetical protein
MPCLAIALGLVIAEFVLCRGLFCRGLYRAMITSLSPARTEDQIRVADEYD